MDALVLAKRIGNLLNEVLDLSQQMAEALNRDDEVTISLLISMRTEPIQGLQIADKALRGLVDGIPSLEEREHLRALLTGGAAADPMEEALAKQIAVNSRTHQRVIALERILNPKITKDKSIFS